MTRAMERLQASIRKALDERRTNPSSVARTAGLPQRALYNVLHGHVPSLDRAAEICEALGLELHVGLPPESEEAQVKRFVGSVIRQTSEAATVDELRRDLRGLLSGIDDLRADIAALRGEPALSVLEWSSDEGLPRGAHPVGVVKLAAMAGGGVDQASEEVSGRIWFRRDWLESHGLDPERCTVIGVRGDAMAPTLPDGCSILVDRSSVEWRLEHVYVLRTGDGLVVKRAGEREDGSRLLVCDNPAWEPEPYPDDADIFGHIVWSGRAIMEPVSE